MRLVATSPAGVLRARARRLQEQSRQRRFAFWRIYIQPATRPRIAPTTRASER